MKWASASSENLVFESAVEECCNRIERELKARPDLAVVFVSLQHARFYPDVPTQIYKRLKPKKLLGCSAGGVIGGGREIEHKTGISVTAAVLPDVEITPFYVDNDNLPDMDARPKAWHDLVGVTPQKEPHFVILADPFSLDADRFVKGLDYAFAKSTKVGGLASGAQKPKENALFLNHDVFREGLAGIALSGNIVLDSVVAQGCRPIGEPMVITACDDNVLLELENEPPLKVLEELYNNLPKGDQELVRSSLFVGIAMIPAPDFGSKEPTSGRQSGGGMNPAMSSLSRGDFLIRNIVGADPEKGILSIGAELREGQTAQFHLRDARTSAEDLDLMLGKYSLVQDKNQAKGGLLFSCLGRGVYLYGTPDHDTKIFQKKIGEIPLGGFFCNGEVGPVHNSTQIHGYTSCFGIFRPVK